MVAQLEINFKPLLTECFATDPDLLAKWHIKAGSGLDSCVEKTFQDLIEARVLIFRVTNDQETVGYFGKEYFEGENYLTGFFIKPQFRSQKSDFWALIQNEFNGAFLCGLYKKNKPAIGFIQKFKGQPIKEVQCADGDAILFKVGA